MGISRALQYCPMIIIEGLVVVSAFILLMLVPWWVVYGIGFISLIWVRGFAGLIVAVVLDVVFFAPAFPYLSCVFVLAMVGAGWIKSRMIV